MAGLKRRTRGPRRSDLAARRASRARSSASAGSQERRTPKVSLAGAHAHGTARPGGAARERLGEGRLLEQGAGGEDGEAVGAHPARHRARGQGLRETRAEVGQELVAGLAAVAGVVGREALDVGADEDVTGAGVSDQKSLGMREEARARLEAGEGVARRGRPPGPPGRRTLGAGEAQRPREAGRYAIKALSEPPSRARETVRPCAAASVSAIAAPFRISSNDTVAVNYEDARQPPARIAGARVSPWRAVPSGAHHWRRAISFASAPDGAALIE